MDKTQPASNQIHIAAALLVALVALLPVAMLFPRLLAFGPPVLGLLAFSGFYACGGNLPRLPRYAVMWAAVIIGLMLVSALWSVDPGFTLKRSLRAGLVFLGGVLLLASCFQIPRSVLLRFAPLYLAAFFTSCLVMVFELYSDGVIYQLIRGPAEGGDFNLSNLNRSVVVLTVGIFVAIACIRRTYSGRTRLALLVAGGILVAAIMYKTHSQSAHLALFVGLILSVAFPYKHRWAWVALATLLCAGVIAAPWIGQAMFKFLPDIVAQFDWFKNSYAPHRMEIWDFTSRRALESPWLGFGAEATRHFEDFDTQRLYHAGSSVLHPHNLFIQFWIEFGALGALVACVFLCSLLYKVAALPPRLARVTLPTVFACISVASTGYGVWQGWWLGSLWLMAVFIVLADISLSSGKAAKS